MKSKKSDKRKAKKHLKHKSKGFFIIAICALLFIILIFMSLNYKKTYDFIERPLREIGNSAYGEGTAECAYSCSGYSACSSEAGTSDKKIEVSAGTKEGSEETCWAKIRERPLTATILIIGDVTMGYSELWVDAKEFECLLKEKDLRKEMFAEKFNKIKKIIKMTFSRSISKNQLINSFMEKAAELAGKGKITLEEENMLNKILREKIPKTTFYKNTVIVLKTGGENPSFEIKSPDPKIPPQIIQFTDPAEIQLFNKFQNLIMTLPDPDLEKDYGKGAGPLDVIYKDSYIDKKQAICTSKLPPSELYKPKSR
ncbi:MAG: hypothetical protein Q8N99_01940 [Nanoarchaeota archaeon]|nr:hypothetical protein [Nanoarchaeota archaeon]